MKARLLASIIVCLMLSACSTQLLLKEQSNRSGDKVLHISEQTLADNPIEIGKSRKDDIEKNLGKTQNIRFNNGFELWSYRIEAREKGKSADTVRDQPQSPLAIVGRFLSLDLGSKTDSEFAVLFNRDGVAVKATLRKRGVYFEGS